MLIESNQVILRGHRRICHFGIWHWANEIQRDRFGEPGNRFYQSLKTGSSHGLFNNRGRCIPIVADRGKGGHYSQLKKTLGK